METSAAGVSCSDSSLPFAAAEGGGAPPLLPTPVSMTTTHDDEDEDEDDADADEDAEAQSYSRGPGMDSTLGLWAQLVIRCARALKRSTKNLPVYTCDGACRLQVPMHQR
jgi:hypothetical protein